MSADIIILPVVRIEQHELPQAPPGYVSPTKLGFAARRATGVAIALSSVTLHFDNEQDARCLFDLMCTRAAARKNLEVGYAPSASSDDSVPD